jgi:hypothetical protein
MHRTAVARYLNKQHINTLYTFGCEQTTAFLVLQKFTTWIIRITFNFFFNLCEVTVWIKSNDISKCGYQGLQAQGLDIHFFEEFFAIYKGLSASSTHQNSKINKYYIIFKKSHSSR